MFWRLINVPENMRQRDRCPRPDLREMETCIRSKLQWCLWWRRMYRFGYSWERVGIKPFWKFLYQRGPKVGLWKLREGSGSHQLGEENSMLEEVQHSLWLNAWEIGTCVPSSLKSVVLSPRGPWLHVSDNCPPIWPVLNHTVY